MNSDNRDTRPEGSREEMEREAQTRLIELVDPITAIACYADACLVNLEPGDGGADMLGGVLQEISAQAHRTGVLVRQLRQLMKEARMVRNGVG